MADLESIANKLTVREGDVVAVVHPTIAQAVHDGIRLATTGDPTIMNPEVKPKPYEGRYMVVDVPDTESLIPVSTDEHGKPTSEYPNRLAGEMVLGYFGEIGYVDMIQQRGSPRLIGIVHIPRRLVYLIGAIKGDEGLERFYEEFCRETEGDRWKGYRWNLQAHPTELNSDALKGLPIEQESYYWKIEKGESDIFKNARPVAEQIGDYETAVRSFVTKLDNHIWMLQRGMSPDAVITPEAAQARFGALKIGMLGSLLLERPKDKD